MADWGARVRRRLEEKGIQVKGSGVTTTITNTITANNKANSIQNGINTTDYQTPVHRVRQILRSPYSDSSPERDVQYINNLRNQDIGSNGDDPDDEDNELINTYQEEDERRHRVRPGGSDGKEFQIVNPRNSTITTFTGKNLHSNPY